MTNLLGVNWMYLSLASLCLIVTLSSPEVFLTTTTRSSLN